MGKHLSHSEWLDKPAPMHWIKASKIKNWPNVQVELCEKWLEAKTKGWFYHAGDHWIFELKNDLVTFKMFVLTDHFTEDIGSIESS